MNVSQAVEGFLLYAHGAQLSPDTASNYQYQLTRFVDQYGDRELKSISSQDIDIFLDNLSKTEYQKTKSTRVLLSQSSVIAHYRTLRALFAWAARNAYLEGHPRPDNNKVRKPPQAVVTPFTRDEVRKLLKACEYTKEINSDGKRSYSMKRPTHLRDRAIILMLLDTGLRVGEMCRLTIADVNLASAEITIKPYLSGLKSKGRHLYLGGTAREALWHYLTTRKKDYKDQPLFKTMQRGALDRHAVGRLLDEMGKRAGVPNCHPHKFRHTYAIEALRNGMDIFTLKTNMGHSSFQMVNYYLSIAQSDQKAAQEKNSPADRWRL